MNYLYSISPHETLMAFFGVSGAVYDMTESYTMAFVIGGILVMLSAVVMVQPYYYVRHHISPDAEEITVEKETLTNNDADGLLYKSHKDLVQMTVSLESLSATHRALREMRATLRSTASLNTPKSVKSPVSRTATAKGKLYRPIGKDLLAMTYSTETI